jgi:hypothetical protein
MSRTALIDHSTISAAQRLLGYIPTFDLSVVDADLVAFENFVEAILLFDGIVCVDDYKAEYKRRRASPGLLAV